MIKTEQIPCKTEGCGATILPTTAAKTGGFCMPCHQWQTDGGRRDLVHSLNYAIGLTDAPKEPAATVSTGRFPATSI